MNMAGLLLFYLFQLLSGVSIPLYTVHYGRMSVPIVLQYQTEADQSQQAVAPGWTLRMGENLYGIIERDTIFGDGMHYWYGPHGALRRLEDDAGNCIEFSDEGMFWPRGSVNFTMTDGFVRRFTVLDADSTMVCLVTFEAESELDVVRICGRDSTETREYKMLYAGPSMLQSIAQTNGGSVEFSFVPEGNRLLKRSVLRKDAEGRVTGTSEYAYGNDSLNQNITETVTDGQAAKRKVVRSFSEGRLLKKEEYSGDNKLTRSTLYQYTEGGKEGRLKSVTTVSYPLDSLSSPRKNVHSYKYATGHLYPYPVEVETSEDAGISERLTYTYPFCPSREYGPIADSLLARGMSGVVLSTTRWKNGVWADSTSVVYDGFHAVNAPSGRMFRPSAVVYTDTEDQFDACIKYTSYDAMGLRASRATMLHKRNADRLPHEVFRWTAIDPCFDLFREQLAYEVCAAWSDVVPNQELGDSFLFDGAGAYLGKVEAGDPKGRVIVDKGFGDESLSACFADPEMMPSMMDRHTTLEIVSTSTMATDLAKAGAFERSHHGLFKGAGFLFWESRFGRQLDFATNGNYDIYPYTLYVTEAGPNGAIVHDNYNYGNFLWGATAFEVGIPRWMALLGAHLHSFFSPYSFGSLESSDDILSILAGYHWGKK